MSFAIFHNFKRRSWNSMYGWAHKSYPSHMKSLLFAQPHETNIALLLSDTVDSYPYVSSNCWNMNIYDGLNWSGAEKWKYMHLHICALFPWSDMVRVWHSVVGLDDVASRPEGNGNIPSCILPHAKVAEWSLKNSLNVGCCCWYTPRG